MTAVLFGARSENFLKQRPLRDHEWCCVSLITAERSYDFALSSSKQAIIWVQGLQQLWMASSPPQQAAQAAEWAERNRYGRLLWKSAQLRLRTRRRRSSLGVLAMIALGQKEEDERRNRGW